MNTRIALTEQIADPYALHPTSIVLDVNPGLHAQVDDNDLIDGIVCPVSGVVFRQTDSNRLRLVDGLDASGEGDENRGMVTPLSIPASLTAVFQDGPYTVVAWHQYLVAQAAIESRNTREFILNVGTSGTYSGALQFGMNVSGGNGQQFSRRRAGAANVDVTIALSAGNFAADRWMFSVAMQGSESRPSGSAQNYHGTIMDAIEAWETSTATATDEGASTHIGLLAGATNGASNNARTKLRRLIVWNKALTPAELLSLRNGTFAAWGLA